MYIPEIYKNENQQEIAQFIADNGFAILINETNGKPWATHVPLLQTENEQGEPVLVGHLSKGNPQAKQFKEDELVLAVFSGPHCYISSSWYDHENVPTWNYEAVHVYGKVRVLDDKKGLEILKKLVDKYEKNSENPVRVENLSPRTMMEARGITSFEIAITAIEAVHKMSQNRDAANKKRIIQELEKTNDPQAHLVAQKIKQCPF